MPLHVAPGGPMHLRLVYLSRHPLRDPTPSVLTEEQGVYITDFGLAASPRFKLSPPEQALHALNRMPDAAYVVTYGVNWVATVFAGQAVW